MPRIEQRYLDASIYLYASKQSAEDGENFGGSGCLVSVESTPVAQFDGRKTKILVDYPLHVYAVTNKHVARGGFPVIRLNTIDGEHDVLELGHHDWIPHPDGDDLAVAPIELGDSRFHYFPIGLHMFVSQPGSFQYIGAGDETFMVGRFTTHGGKQRNTPTLRFGNIAMLPFEKVKLHDGFMQEAFLVETRSISGYSGSPVFVYRPKKTTISQQINDPYAFSSYESMISRLGEAESITDLVGHLYLLGIDCGHVPSFKRVVNGAGTPHPQGWKVESNTGMAIVIPAWRLEEFLQRPELTMKRITKNKQYRENQENEERAVADLEGKPSPLTEEGYFDALKRASRKVSETSQPAPKEKTSKGMRG